MSRLAWTCVHDRALLEEMAERLQAEETLDGDALTQLLDRVLPPAARPSAALPVLGCARLLPSSGRLSARRCLGFGSAG